MSDALQRAPLRCRFRHYFRKMPGIRRSGNENPGAALDGRAHVGYMSKAGLFGKEGLTTLLSQRLLCRLARCDG